MLEPHSAVGGLWRSSPLLGQRGRPGSRSTKLFVWVCVSGRPAPNESPARRHLLGPAGEQRLWVGLWLGLCRQEPGLSRSQGWCCKPLPLLCPYTIPGAKPADSPWSWWGRTRVGLLRGSHRAGVWMSPRALSPHRALCVQCCQSVAVSLTFLWCVCGAAAPPVLGFHGGVLSMKSC